MYPLRSRASPPLPHCYPFIVWLVFQNSLLLKAVDSNLLKLSVVPANIKGVESVMLEVSKSAMLRLISNQLNLLQGIHLVKAVKM